MLGSPLLPPPEASEIVTTEVDRRRHSGLWEPLKAGGEKCSICTLVSTAIGAGVLATPYAVAQLGFLLGSAVLCFSAFSAFLGMYILAASFKATNAVSYHDLLRPMRLALMVDLLIALNGIGCCASYFVFLGDFLPPVLKAFYFPHQFTDRTLVLTFSLFFIWPLCIQKRLSSLRTVAAVPVIALTLTCAVLLYEAPFQIKAHLKHPVELDLFRLNWNFFKAFNVFLFAFMQHMNVCPVLQELRQPNPHRIRKIVRWAIVSELLLYSLMANVCYMSFGAETEQNFIQNFPHNAAHAITICRLLLAVSMFINIPINMIPACRSISQLFKSLTCPNDQFPTRMERDRVCILSEDNLSVSSQVAAKRSSTSLLLSAEVPFPLSSQAPQETTSRSRVESNGFRIFLATICLVLSYGLSLCTDQVADVISLIGGLFPTPLMFTFPAILFVKVIKVRQNEEIAPLRRVPLRLRDFLVYFFLITASLMGILSACMVILQQLQIVPSA